MCDCIENISNQQLENQSKSTGKKVSSFEFTEDAIGLFLKIKTGKESLKTKSTIRYTLEGQRKVYRSYMHHNFCPFCGKKY